MTFCACGYIDLSVGSFKRIHNVVFEHDLLSFLHGWYIGTYNEHLQVFVDWMGLTMCS